MVYLSSVTGYSDSPFCASEYIVAFILPLSIDCAIVYSYQCAIVNSFSPVVSGLLWGLGFICDRLTETRDPTTRKGCFKKVVIFQGFRAEEKSHTLPKNQASVVFMQQ